MIIKVISLWQPWAEAMRRLLKKNETRSWYTPHRGWLAIHAAKKRFNPNEYTPEFVAGCRRVGWPDELTYGAVLCVVKLIDCQRTEDIVSALSPGERFWGNYEPGRFAWMTDATKHITLAKPVPLVGHQGLFNWELPPEIEALLPREQFALEGR